MVKIGEETNESGQIIEIFQDGSAVIRTPKAKPQQAKYKTAYSHLNFIERFDIADQMRYMITFEDIINNNESYTAEDKLTHINTIKLIKAKFDKATYIDLTDARVEEGLNTLANLGIIVTTTVEDIITPDEVVG